MTKRNITLIERKWKQFGGHEWFSLFRCFCGVEFHEKFYRVERGVRDSCGCLGRTRQGVRHGGFGTRAYTTWCGMIARCENPKLPYYKDYGGRGIAVCKEWRASFPKFYEDMGNPPKNRSLDRIDNDKGYSKENCRWATKKQQAHNSRPGRHWIAIVCVETGEEFLSLKKAAKHFKTSPQTIRLCIKNNKKCSKGLTFKFKAVLPV